MICYKNKVTAAKLIFNFFLSPAFCLCVIAVAAFILRNAGHSCK